MSRASAGGLVILTGPAGVGKSAVALAYATVPPRGRLGTGRPLVWWVQASDVSSLTGGLLSVARLLGAYPDDLTAIRRRAPDSPDRLWGLLEGSPHPWVLVFDNADDPGVLGCPPMRPCSGTRPCADGRVLPADGTGWVRRGKRGLVIVTSRDGDAAAWGHGTQVVRLPPLQVQDAARLLRDWAPGAGSEAEARRLAARIGGLPLPLMLAARDLSSDVTRRRSFGDYVHDLDDPGCRPRLLSPEPGLGTPADDRSVVLRTWELSLDELSRRGVPQGRHLLRLLSCFAAAIPVPHTHPPGGQRPKRSWKKPCTGSARSA